MNDEHSAPRRDWTRAEPAGPARLMLWIIALLVALTLGWAASMEVEVVALAQGRVVPPAQLQIVQPAESGIVRDILVREGERVITGQVLARMDAKLSEADVRQLDNEISLRRLQLRRIDAELNGTVLRRQSGEPEALYAQVEQQFRARRQAHLDAISTERAVLAKAEQDLRGAVEIESKLRQTLPIYREQESAIDQLTRDGFAGKMMLLERRRDRIEKEQDLAAQQFQIASYRATITQTQQRIAQVQSGYRQGLHNERVDTEASLHRLSRELDKLAHRRGLLELRSPRDGLVKDLATRTPGSVVAAGTVLMTVVPTDDSLQAEVWVRHQDAGLVEPGQDVRLKFVAFPFHRYGIVRGRVVHISPDASDLPQSAQLERRRTADEHVLPASGYRALVELDAGSLQARGRTVRLSPGMQTVAELLVDRRTVLDYVLGPVSRTIREAGREP